MRRLSRSLQLLLLAVSLLLPAFTLASKQDPGTLVIGKVSHNPKKHYHYLKPIADYVAARMGDLGIVRAKVLMARDNQQMIHFLRQGRVDWVTETVMSASEFAMQAGGEILLRKWKKGVPDYYTVFFTREESDIYDLASLVGRKLALEDPGSTTAFFVPVQILLERGFHLVRLDSLRNEPPEDAIGYVLSREEINASTLVHQGLVDAAAFNNLDWEKKDHLPHIFQRDMRIIHRSATLPRAVELVRAGLDPAIKGRLRALLLGAHLDANASYALQAYQQTSRFSELSDAELALVLGLYRTVTTVREWLK